MPRRHVVISGTGRAGTSFLVELLTHLELDTGYTAENVGKKKSKLARAGLEKDIRKPNAPFIVKSPWFFQYADEVLNRNDIIIEHVFIPIRDLTAASESRRFVTAQTVAAMPALQQLWFRLFPKAVTGGLFQTLDGDRQEEVLLGQFYQLALTLSKTKIPITFMRFPNIVNDASYLFEKLKPILGEIQFDRFQSVFTQVVCKELVHCFSANDRAA